MNDKIFTMSENGKEEYSITVVRIGELKPIEGSDFLAQTYIGDASLVIRKDEVKEGDLMFYASNECQMSERFLSVNNLFDIGCCEKNSNFYEMKRWVDRIEKNKELLKTDLTDERRDELNKAITNDRTYIKKQCGFFPSNGRVRMINLKQTPSMGFLFGMKEMVKFCDKVRNINLEEYVHLKFDTVDGGLFVKAYVPPIKAQPMRVDGSRKRNKKLKRFDRMIEGEFSFHYDTKQLGDYMFMVKPSSNVTIDVKLHGSSGIFSNIKTRKPIKLPFHKWLLNKFIDATGLFKSHRIVDYEIAYDSVYSSRTVIKNKYINRSVTDGYYTTDIWGEYNVLLNGKIDKGLTVYGEIIGYCSNSDKMIQKGYDYGCSRGTNKFMPYRITSETDSGKKYEWNVTEVKEWTEHLIEKYPEIKDRIQVIPILYHGTLQDLYPNVDIHNHWQENVLQEMIKDKHNFGMEMLEPMCKNKVPREGIVLRIDDDPCAEAFKLKCVAFRQREAKQIDKGEVDMEMTEGYENVENEQLS